jgi:deoxyribonuclease-4
MIVAAEVEMTNPRKASEDPGGTSPAERPLIGAQIKTAGGFFEVPQRAMDIGAEVVQIFNSNARTWRPKLYNPDEIATLRAGLDRFGLPLFFHTIYLINLASPDEELRAKSSAALAEALFIGAVAGASGVVTHVGSHRGFGFSAACTWVEETVAQARKTARERMEEFSLDLPPAALLLESGAGAGSTLGRDLAELEVISGLLGPCCGVCLDTAHLFASGHPIHTADGLEEFVEDLHSRSLLERVALIHLNDSRTSFGSGRDHHENLGAGQIGFDGLARVVTHPAFRDVPFVLEVPGLDDHGPDRFSLQTAKAMRAGDSGPPTAPVPPA